MILLISHTQKNKDLINNNHVFEVQFMHKIDDNTIVDNLQNNLHYTEWDYLLNSINTLYEGVDVHTSKNNKRFTNVK